MSDLSISCYSSRLLIKYAHGRHIDILSFLPAIVTPYHEMMDVRAWMPLAEWLKLLRYVAEQANKSVEQLAYEIIYDLKSQLTFRIWLLGILPIYLVKKFRILNWVFPRYINTNLYVQFEEVTAHSFIISFLAKDPALYTKEVCDFHRGCARAMLEIRGYEEVQFTELSCITRGDPSCRHRLTWGARDAERGLPFVRSFYASVKKEKLDMSLRECLLDEKEIDVLFNKGESHE